VSWIETLVAVDAEIVACERRFGDQCARVVTMTVEGQNTAEDEVLIASYRASLTLIRMYRDQLLQDAEKIA
jgi:hypothetical protein